MMNFSPEGKDAIKLLQSHLGPMSDRVDSLVARLRDLRDRDAALHELAGIRQGLLDEIAEVEIEHRNTVAGLAIAFTEQVRERLESQ